MIKGATENETGHGLEIERQYLDAVHLPALRRREIHWTSARSTTRSAGP